MDKQYSVLGRPRKKDTRRFNAPEIVYEITQHLAMHAIQGNVTYAVPNIIIHLTSPHQQANLLSRRPLQLTNYIVDLLPWSTELEFAQMPWITAFSGNADDISTVAIDPLSILPVTSNYNSYQGKYIMKDTFASTLHLGYELKAPDFSYIMITKLKDFFNSKYEAIVACKEIVIHMGSLLQDFTAEITTMLQSSSNKIQLLQFSNHNNSKQSIQYLSDQLDLIKNYLLAEGFYINNEHLDSVRRLPNRFIDLHGFQDLPSLYQVPVTDTYNTRLDIIHQITTQQAYGAESNITTVQTPDHRYEAYITIRGRTYRYNEAPQKTAATIRAMTIYESLKHITNILGYNIMDSNYPTLSNIVSTVNNYNQDLVLLQICVSAISSYTETIYEDFVRLQNLYTEFSYNANLPDELKIAIRNFVTTTENHHKTIQDAYYQFMNAKVQYFRIFINTESTLTTAGRWIQASPPTSAA